LKWIADENIPLASVNILREKGFDIASISDRQPGIPDQVVLDIAHREGRSLLTFDRDFGELIFQKRLPPPPAIVFLRITPSTPSEPAELILSLIDSTEHIENRFLVLDNDSIRSRPLPDN